MKTWHPEIIPIKREEDYHTHYIGKTQDGKQFLGYVTFAFSGGHIPDVDWESKRREYVLIYIFDLNGNYIETIHRFAGTTQELKGVDLYKDLELMLNQF